MSRGWARARRGGGSVPGRTVGAPPSGDRPARSLDGGSHLGGDGVTPVVEALEHRTERSSATRELVAGRSPAAAALVPDDEPQLFEVAQALGQYLVAQHRDQGAKLRVVQAALLQMGQDDGLPLAVQDFERELDRAGEPATKRVSHGALLTNQAVRCAGSAGP